jgi:hypothetical protein
MQKLYFFLFFIPFLCAGCQKYYISISQDRVDRDFLASTQAKTPDPRQENPPLGERLIIEWQLPRSLLEQEPSLHLHVIYKNYTEKVFVYPVHHRLDYVVYSLLDQEYQESKGILTYKADVQTQEGKSFVDWKHQLWTNLIVLEEDQEEQSAKESDSCTESMSSSVCSQPIQGSVTETEGEAKEEGS